MPFLPVPVFEGHRWGNLLAAVVARHPKLHVVFIAGNHDSLLCSQGSDCVSCNFPKVFGARARWPLATDPLAIAEVTATMASSSSPSPSDSSLASSSSLSLSSPHHPRSALAELLACVPAQHLPRVHYLDHTHVDIDLNTTPDIDAAARHLPPGTQPAGTPDGMLPPETPFADALIQRPRQRRVVRVFGSAWTPQFSGGLNQHFTFPDRDGHEDHTRF
jgi:hypothetical protein